MHIDKWVKASVFVAIVMGVPGWIGVFKPNNFSKLTPVSSIAASPSTATVPNTADQSVETTMQMFLAVMQYVGPILSSGLLLAVVVLAFRKSRESPGEIPTNQGDLAGLRKQIVDETSAKMDREGRLQQLQKQYDNDIVVARSDLKECQARRLEEVDALKGQHATKMQEIVNERNASFDEAALLKKEIAALKSQETIGRAAFEELQARYTALQDSNVGQLLIEYKPKERIGKMELLVLINEGSVTLRNIAVGPLLWGDGLVRRELNLLNVVGPLRPKQQVECSISVYEQQGNSQNILELPDMLRQVIRQVGNDAQATVRVAYEDLNRRCFSRDFLSSIDVFDRVVFDPVGPVRFERDASDAR